MADRTAGGFSKEEWKQEKQEWKERIESVDIPSDIQGKVPYYESELDTLYTEACWYYEQYTNKLKGIEDKIDVIMKQNKDKGSNKEEREANALLYVINYPSGNPKDQSTTNLLEFRDELRKRHHFFKNYVMKALNAKSDVLRNDVGAMKTDAQFTSNYKNRESKVI